MAADPELNSQKRPGLMFLLIAVSALMLIGYVSTRIFRPERLARVMHCAGPVNGEPVYQNVCNFDIYFQYCLYSKRGAEYDVCRTVRLAPEEGVVTLADDLNALGGLHNAGIYACKVPYVPGQYVHPNTHRMTAGCVKADDPNAGPHMSRSDDPR